MIDINYVEEKMKQSYMKKDKKITNWDWELLNRQLNAIRNRLTKLEMRCEVDSEDIIMMNNKLNELEEENFNNTMTIERLEHSEDKEYLESIEHCKECIKLGINDEECSNYNNCKFYKKRPCKNCKWCKVGVKFGETEHYCMNKESKFWNMMVNKEEYTCENWEEKSKQNKKWIVHRTLRKKGRETYISVTFGKPFYTERKEKAQRFTMETAIALRDELNKQRIGKRFLWVVSRMVKG